ncbi:desert hedgehog protein B-like [Stegodyphus dumicola]|uniref:desert hedgehog protein B-like n=1 Tax=Stegodyphus dumicola TaxID=202533 RepID=UPI0015B21CEF|nr:desert hedgehog protein B-like [Stegodyphus dumicola]
MNQWPGIRLRVTEGYDEEGHHSRNSLHYEGRAVDITTSDRDPSKYGMLARLAVDAGFDWVFYEARSHIHCSVKIESTVPSKSTGCFHGSSKVMTRKGTKLMQELHIGDEVLTFFTRTKSIGYSYIIAFLHRDPHAITTFMKMKTEFNSSLLITANHIVFHSAMDQEFQGSHASNLRVGDSVYTFHSYELRKVVINSIDYQLMTGVFAPLTEEGTIIVNGIWTSCYAVVDNHILAHFILLPLRLIYKLETMWPTNNFIFHILNKAAPWDAKPLIATFGFDETKELNKVHWFPRTLCRLTTTMHLFYCPDDVD